MNTIELAVKTTEIINAVKNNEQHNAVYLAVCLVNTVYETDRDDAVMKFASDILNVVTNLDFSIEINQMLERLDELTDWLDA